MTVLYELIGRLVFWAVRTRFQRELRIAAGVGALGVLGLVVGGYFAATREPPEG
jgi:hypothetical protein